MVHWWVLVHTARIGEHTSQVKPERIPALYQFQPGMEPELIIRLISVLYLYEYHIYIYIYIYIYLFIYLFIYILGAKISLVPHTSTCQVFSFLIFFFKI